VISHAAVASRVVTEPDRSWDADQALEALYAAHWRSLVRLAVLLVHDRATAEEVVQDAFVSVHAHWGRLRDPERGLAYLRQAVVNRARSVLRHRGVVDRHARREAAGLSVAVPPEPDVEHAGRRTAVLDALRSLPERQREVITLRYYLDLSEGEIADALGISRGAVKSHGSRGAAALRQRLAPWWEEER
jgi:RNA polymerase sigma-70 factor (sigma-E family)